MQYYPMYGISASPENKLGGFFRGVGSAIAGIFKSKQKKSKQKKVITRSMARDNDSDGDDCDMMEERCQSRGM